MNFNKEKAKRSLVAVGVFGGLLGLIMIGLWISDRDRQHVPRSERVEEVSTFSAPGSRIDPARVWITQSETELSTLRQQNTQLSAALERLQRDVQALNEQRSRGVSADQSVDPVQAGTDGYPQANIPAPRILPTPGSGAGQLNIGQVMPGITQAITSDLNTEQQEPVNTEIISVSLVPPETAEQQTSAAETSSRRTLENFLPAGSFITVTLLSGANAPTGGLAQSNPVPVLLQLDDDGNLPNRFTSRVRDCRITTAAYGDLPSERAYLRTEKLTCISTDGEILETAIKGYVSGEDGMAGMRGPVVEKRARLIAMSLLSGGLGGIGSALSQGLTTLSTNSLGSVMSVTPSDALEYGAWSGVGKAMERLADWYLERADELYPVIEVHAGRFGHVVLTEGLDLTIDLWAEGGQE